MPSINFNPHDNAIILEVKLSGKVITTTRLVLDTGASLLMIPWRIATQVGLDIDPTQIVQTTTAPTVKSSPLVSIPRVSVLGETVADIEALVKDLPPESGVDGLLGLSFLRHFNVDINFQKGKLTLKKF